jgi:hypothetical protein
MMDEIESSRLAFRRQYLIAPSAINCPFRCKQLKLNSRHILYSHVDLLVHEIEKNHVRLVLLGDIFDFKQPGKGNPAILKDLIDLSFSALLERLTDYSGRFVMIHIENNAIRIVHDAIAARKVYYCNHGQFVWLASRPNLLARVLNLKITENASKIDFYNSPEFKILNNSNIGNTTIYDTVFQLIPNFYLDVDSCQAVRYWPNKRLVYQPVSEVAVKCAEIIKGTMKSISNRYPVMLPLTAGKDSRLLMAATKDFCENVYFYTNRSDGLDDEHSDISVPNSLLAHLGLEYHVIEPCSSVDEEFKTLFFNNNSLASSRYLPFIYNYYIKHPEKVNLPGNIATGGFEMFKSHHFHFSGKSMASLYKVEKFEHARDYYASWLSGAKDLCREYNIDLVSLFYWEERLANWGTQIQMEKDIAQEEINPFNSRALASLFFSVKPKYLKEPLYILHKRIIKILWPELLAFPINPCLKNSIKSALAFLGLLEYYDEVWYGEKFVKSKKLILKMLPE